MFPDNWPNWLIVALQLVLLLLALSLVLYVIANSIYWIKPHERAAVDRWGKERPTLTPRIYFRLWLLYVVRRVDIRVQEVRLSVSRELIFGDVELAIRYRVDSDHARAWLDLHDALTQVKTVATARVISLLGDKTFERAQAMLGQVTEVVEAALNEAGFQQHGFHLEGIVVNRLTPNDGVRQELAADEANALRYTRELADATAAAQVIKTTADAQAARSAIETKAQTDALAAIQAAAKAAAEELGVSVEFILGLLRAGAYDDTVRAVAGSGTTMVIAAPGAAIPATTNHAPAVSAA